MTRPPRSEFVRHLLLTAMLFATPLTALATDVRGLVEASGYRGNVYPVEGTTVELFREQHGEKRSVGRAFTRYDGMFHFKDIAPGPYYIRVGEEHWFKIDIRNRPRQDLPRIRLP